MQVPTHRLESIRRILNREEIDVLFSMKKENVFYLTGLSLPIPPPLVIIVPVDNEATLIAPSKMLSLADEASKIKDVRPYFSDTAKSERDQKKPDFLDVVRAAIEEKDLDKRIIGLEYENTSLSMFNRLKDLLPDAGFKDTSSLIWEM
ncbi:MAG: aminopeptidase P family N-terminal domain-containing protein, partial [Promethearchaeota archaeon]